MTTTTEQEALEELGVSTDIDEGIIYIFRWQLDSMHNYSSTLPDATTSFKMWKKRHGRRWYVGQYYPTDIPGRTGIHWFKVAYLTGPIPPDWEPPDWARQHAYEGPFMFPKHIKADGSAVY